MFNPAEALRDNPALFACYVLFTYFQGRNAVRIEREMRALGYSTFHRRNLYPRGHQPGWIAKYWSADTPVRMSVASTRKESANTRKRSIDPHDLAGAAADADKSVRTPPDDFHSWLKRVAPNMTWDWRHQQVIIKQLEEFTAGKRQRLMIFLPPRHGKTELVSVKYTAWRMQRDPSMNVILGSYNQRLADKMSRQIRSTLCDSEAIRLGKGRNTSGSECAPQPIDNSSGQINSADHSQEGRFTPALLPAQDAEAINNERWTVDNESRSQRAAATGSEIIRSPPSIIHPKELVHSQLSTINSSPFPFSRPRPKNAVSEWETAAGGSFRAVGSGSGVTGFGANLIVIDDPVKNRAQAESETFRNRVWDWYKDDLYTRLEPDGSIVLIQTRWHEDDLAGRLLRENLDNWTIINLPALAEEASAVDNGQRTTESEEHQDETRHNDTRLPSSVPPAAGPPGRASRSGVEDAGGWSHPIETEGIEINSTDLSQEGRFTPAPTMENRLRTIDNESGSQADFGQLEIGSELIRSPLSVIHFPEIVHSPLSTVHRFDWRQAGEALCPERFPVEALEQQRRQLGTYSFSALYQQRPTPAGGEIFKREWFKQIIDFAPPGLKWKRGYDLAVSTKTESDYTASFRCAFDDKTGNLYISGGFRRRMEFPDQRRYIIDRIMNERDTEHGVELALHGQALLQDLRRDPALRGKSLRGVKVSTDKLTRALTWSPIAEEGKVILVRSTTDKRQRTVDNGRRHARNSPPYEGGVDAALGGRGGSPRSGRTDLNDLETCDTEIFPRTALSSARSGNETASEIVRSQLSTLHSQNNVHSPLSIVSWIDDLLDELTAFPNGTHDDQIDAISIAVQMHSVKPRTGGGFLIT